MTRALWIALLCCLAFPAAGTEVKEVKTPGGLTAWLVEEHGLPLVAVKIAFRGSGYAYDPVGFEGRANMTAALLMEGAGDLKSNEFNEALEEYAIQLNTHVDDDLFNVSFEALSEHKDKAMSLAGLAITRPRFDGSSMERTRRQTLSLLVQQEENPGYRLQRGWQTLAFGKHPYGKPSLGTKQSVESLDDEQLRDFTTRYLTRENIIIAAVGDITPQELGELLDKHLANLPAKYAPDVTVEDIAIPAGSTPTVIDFDIPQTMVAFGIQGLKRKDPDYFTLFVMNQIIGGGGLNSRLGDEIREKRGLAYSVYSFINPSEHAAAWNGGFSTRNEQAGTAYAIMRDTLKKFADVGPTAKETSDAKKYLTGSFVLSLDSNAEIASYLISMQLHHLGIDYLDRRNAMINAVTQKDMHALAKRLIDADKLLVVMVGKPKLAEDKP
jgi:zinc protease